VIFLLSVFLAGRVITVVGVVGAMSILFCHWIREL